MMDALTALTSRASASGLIEPAPDDDALRRMIEAAVAAPDHGRLRPWHFIAVRGEARDRLGEVLAAALHSREPEAPTVLLDKERQKTKRAPLILIAAARLIAQHKIPTVEQIVAVGAAVQNLLVAAHAMGFGAMWRTGAPAYDAAVKQALGLGADDRIVGFIYLGTPATTVTAANRPAPESCLVEWRQPAS